MHEQYCYKGKKILIIKLKKTSAIINHTAVKKKLKKNRYSTKNAIGLMYICICLKVHALLQN